jgi:hypothetical protein
VCQNASDHQFPDCILRAITKRINPELQFWPVSDRLPLNDSNPKPAGRAHGRENWVPIQELSPVRKRGVKQLSLLQMLFAGALNQLPPLLLPIGFGPLVLLWILQEVFEKMIWHFHRFLLLTVASASDTQADPLMISRSTRMSQHACLRHVFALAKASSCS